MKTTNERRTPPRTGSSRIRAAALGVALALGAAGCSPSIWKRDWEDRTPLFEKYAGSAGTRAREVHPLWSDSLGHNPGDLVTVIIREGERIESGERSEVTKSSKLEGGIDNFDVKPNTFKTLPRMGVSSERSFKGSGTMEKQAAFETRLAAVVLKVMPNGLLAIEGRRTVDVDDEQKIVIFRGLIRESDVRPDNTVMSESVAAAEVYYEGTGPMSSSTRKGLASQVLDFLLDLIWPF